jgi:hypothetical protein
VLHREGDLALTKTSGLLMISLLGLMLPGCGTCSNLAGQHQSLWIGLPTREPSPFGGVGNDCRDIAALANENLWMAIPLFTCDLPLSLVGDVFTLPRVLAMRQEWEQAKQTGIWPVWARDNLEALAAVQTQAISGQAETPKTAGAETRPPPAPNH